MCEKICFTNVRLLLLSSASSPHTPNIILVAAAYKLDEYVCCVHEMGDVHTHTLISWSSMPSHLTSLAYYVTEIKDQKVSTWMTKYTNLSITTYFISFYPSSFFFASPENYLAFGKNVNLWHDTILLSFVVVFKQKSHQKCQTFLPLQQLVTNYC